MSANSHHVLKRDYLEYRQSQRAISEAQLENALIYYLCNDLKYQYNPAIKTQRDLKTNFKAKLELLNKVELPEREFEKIWIQLNQGDTLDLFKQITYNQPQVEINHRTRVLAYFDFDTIQNNHFEIINQLRVANDVGTSNRFDVLLLVNGIPLIHIELKSEEKNFYDATRQISFYKEIGAISKFLNLVKLFVISNGTNTQYLANNNNVKALAGIRAYTWTDANNEPLQEFLSFAQHFLDQAFLLNFVNNYFVASKTDKVVNIMRPYQYHAVNCALQQIHNPHLTNAQKSGYVWHATGSGKTITSFKLCEFLAAKSDQIELTIFLVDRNDLNAQTKRVFTSYAGFRESVKIEDATSTKNLIKLLNNNNSDTKIIITTIQKLNHALSEKNSGNLKNIRSKRVVFVVDEGHRSQLGMMRNRINNYFHNAINIAFTGTPIFDVNAKDGKTTENIFGPLIHKYTTFDAMKDKNVLPITFAFKGAEYGQDSQDLDNYDDDLQENNDIVYNENEIRHKVKFIQANHNQITRNKKFNVLVAVHSIAIAMKYYELFQKDNDDDLVVKVIFSIQNTDYSSNAFLTNSQKSFMIEQIRAHNETWGLNELDKYKEEIQELFRSRNDKGECKINILIVVSMLLTGYDSPVTNTLFLDKKLRYHSLIQAISRVNRPYEGKEAGNIIAFATAKEDVEYAFDLYTNGNISTPNATMWTPLEYESLKEKFGQIIQQLNTRFGSVQALINKAWNCDQDIQDFLIIYQQIMKTFNLIRPLIDFSWNDLPLTEHEFRQLRGIYASNKDKDKNRRVIWVNNEFAIVDLDELKVDVAFLEKLAHAWAGRDLTYDDISNYINNPNNFKNTYQQQLLTKIIEALKRKNANLNKLKFKEWLQNFQEAITEIIKQSENAMTQNWNTDKATIQKLLNFLTMKGKITRRDIEVHLPNYVTDFMDASNKIVEVKEKLGNVVDLQNLHNEVRNLHNSLL